VFVILDGMPARHVPRLPCLSSLGVFTVGESVMTSATYPNHATFVTGVPPATHGLVANILMHDGAIRMAHHVGPSVPTLFDTDVRSIVVVGDHHLIGVMGATAASYHWPPDGDLPAATPRDRYDYASDSAVVSALASVVGEPWELLVVHLNEPDTAGHIDGPDSPAAFASYSSTDAALGSVVSLLQPWWDDLVVIVVSDHDQQEVDMSLEPIDLQMRAIPEGSAAVLWEQGSAEWLSDVDGVAGHEEIKPGVHMAWASPGRVFAIPAAFSPGVMHGHHGGIDTRDQVVVVAGGHPRASELASAVRGTRPPATAWAPTMASLLGVPFDGASLLA
jgi:predicted AlkP superfamily pyrophosphatase or phosphodiesterase